MAAMTRLPVDGRSSSRRGSGKGALEAALIRAKDIMAVNVVCVDPSQSVRKVARLLTREKVGAVPVVEGRTVIGIVSEGDLMRRQELGTETSVAGQRTAGGNVDYAKSHGMKACDVMTPNVVSIGEDTPLPDIVEKLQFHQIRRLLVMRGEDLVGLVSRRDVVRVLAARPEGAGAPRSSDDDIIRFKVIEVLTAIRGTSPWLTTVEVSKGVVELGGSIEDETALEPSRSAVLQVPHVIGVRDRRSLLQPYGG